MGKLRWKLCCRNVKLCELKYMRQKMRLFGLLILIIVLVSFKNEKGFIIKGYIDGIEDGTCVKLYDLDQQMYLDSATSKNGNFILKGKVENPTTCWIQCKNEYAIIQVENTEMKITSPIKDMLLNSSIHGGKEQKLQNELCELQRPYELLIHSAYDSLMNNKFSNDKEKQRLIRTLNESQSTSRAIYINFGEKHPNSYLGLDILYKNRKSIPTDSLKMIYRRLTPKLKETSRAKALKSTLYEDYVQIGKSFIDFHVKTLKGDDFSLSSLKGNYIYLTFWSAGCPYCKMENKFIKDNHTKFPADVTLVNFSINKNAKSWERESKCDSIEWYNVSDMAGETGIIKTQYGVQAVPTSFLIDREGIVVEQFVGFDQDIIEKIRTIIEKKKP
jgi:peroxiredoxin